MARRRQKVEASQPPDGNEGAADQNSSAENALTERPNLVDERSFLGRILEFERRQCRCRHRPSQIDDKKTKLTTTTQAAGYVLSKAISGLRLRKHPVPSNIQLGKFLGEPHAGIGQLTLCNKADDQRWINIARQCLLLVLRGDPLPETLGDWKTGDSEVDETIERIIFFFFRNFGVQEIDDGTDKPSFLSPKRLGSKDVFSRRELIQELDFLAREVKYFGRSSELVWVSGCQTTMLGTGGLSVGRESPAELKSPRLLRLAEQGVAVKLIFSRDVQSALDEQLQVLGERVQLITVRHKLRNGSTHEEVPTFLNPALEFVYLASRGSPGSRPAVFKYGHEDVDETLLIIRMTEQSDDEEEPLALWATKPEVDHFKQWLKNVTPS